MAFFDPTRLVVARHRRGLSKTEFAKAVGVSARMVAHYEAGTKEPSTETLRRIAEVLVVEPHFFGQPSLELVAPAGVSFRALSSLSAGERCRVLGAASMAPDVSALVEDTLSVPEPDVPDLGEHDPETAAAILRRDWGLDNKRIANMVHLVETHGVRVFSLAEDIAKVDAFATFIDGHPYVFLNRTKSPERGRLDVGHELGHLVLHRDIDEPRGRAIEAQANRFAGALLAPAETLRDWAYGRRLDDEYMTRVKLSFGMSFLAAVRRHLDLGLITEWEYRDFVVRHHRARWEEPEPRMRDEEQERSYVLEQLAITLRREGRSTKDVASQLGIDPLELHAVTFGLFPVAHENDTAVARTPMRRPATATIRPDLKLVGR